MQGCFLSLSLKGAIAVLPHTLSIWPDDFSSEGRLVPKGQREPPCSSTSKPRRLTVGKRQRNCAQMGKVTKKGEEPLTLGKLNYGHPRV